MISSLYEEVLKAEPQDLFPDVFTESYYSIPLDPNQLIEVLSLLRENGKTEIFNHISSFLKEEYQDFISNYD